MIANGKNLAMHADGIRNIGFLCFFKDSVVWCGVDRCYLAS